MRTWPSSILNGSRLVAACSGALAAVSAAAQPDANDSRGTIRIEVTGSNIPRTDVESALPVQTITAEEIRRSGWSTAAELMAHVSANFNGMNDQRSIGRAGNPGLASANLRGLGDGNTLVLLNGRRLANYAFVSGTVDLSTIPLAALDRVEILKDGASSIYGTDAIAGVVNFITRRDYRGIELTGQAAITQHGGADRYQATVTAGYGDLASDRFNAFVTVDWQKEASLQGRDRPFARTGYRPDEGVARLSLSTFPANIVRGPGRFLNPGFESGCAPPTSLPFTVAFDDPQSLCLFDPTGLHDIIPSTERLSLVARGVWQFAANHQLFGEYVYADRELALRVAPTPIARSGLSTGTPVLYPASGPYYPTAFALQHGLVGDLDLSYRAVTLGPRADDIRTRSHRAVIGLQGTFSAWSYNLAYNHSETTSTDTFVGGYVYGSSVIAAIATGLINPWGPFGTEGQALLEAAQIFGEVRRAKGTLDQFDARAAGELIQLPSGPLSAALGGETRREKLSDQPAAVLDSGDVMSQPFTVDPQDSSRRVHAAFVEFSVPIARSLEAQLSARYDHYSDFGGTTNPKIALRWQPAKSLLLRASWGKGFRAPSLPDLFTPRGASASLTFDYHDPVRCPVTGLPSDCVFLEYLVRTGGNPDLLPEQSKQWSAGAVFEPAQWASIGIDYWNIRKTAVIGTLTEDLILGNFDIYGTSNVVRGAPDAAFPGLPGPITALIGWNQNVGNVETSGVDVSLSLRSPPTRAGRFRFDLDGTYVVEWDEHLNGLPPRSVAGRYGFDPVPRWRHYARLGWENGPWTATLAQTFQSGYTDAQPNEAGEPRRVGTYSVFDLQATYGGFRNATVAVGIRNLFDRPPPFTNQLDTFQVGYDPRYGDPRGRTFYARVTYAFR
jgi:iron complex outermembrane recepter protein